MRIKYLLLCISALFCLMVTTACSTTTPTTDMGELYSLALDAYMPIDEGLNDGIEYIAIDMSNFVDLDQGDKEQILKHFEKFNVEVMEATLEQLKTKGLYDPETGSLDGLLLRVENTEIHGNKMIVDGSKYRSGDGAIGLKVVVVNKEGSWQVVNAVSTWIS
ncbi:peptide ABC transporter substrate-binding protein [Brevibacillus daliensis]|uniref:peptide ABC transporter substrate-binding protein n=1 Tax=Brevibacillus daliensis TaxID=2892995 RepID=UPI001E5267D4|nr:peptide ABC transporter substrate-binding protein [Brevibacillus daliensis]